MAVGGTDIVVRFLGDVSKLRDDVGKIESGFGKLKRVALGMGAALGAAFAGREVLEFGKNSVSAALESEKATAALRNVFRSMGDETGKAAAEAEKFAGVLMRKIGVDDETIMKSQAILATFKNLSSETGRASGMFDRATTAAADMAALGLGSMDSNAIRLGKALNDPIAGVSALNRVGVQFTEEQKNAIKASVEHGDVLAAQNMIMAEVERQVGGTAEATATGTDKMKVAFGEFQEGVGKALLPIINSILPLLTAAFEWAQPIITGAIAHVQTFAAALVEWFKANWPQIRDTAVSVFEAIRDAIMPIVTRIATFVTETLLPAFSRIWDAIRDAAPDVLDAFKGIGDVAQDVFPKIVTVLDKITPVLATIITKLIEFVGWMARNKEIVATIAAPVLAYVAAMKTWALIQKGVALATKGWAVAQGILNAVMAANPIFLIIAAVVALIAVFVLLYMKVDWFRAAIDALWQFMQTAWDAILTAVRAVYNWIKDNWPLLLGILTGPIGVIVLLVIRNFDTIKNAVKSAFDWIKDNWPTLLAILTGPIGVAVLLITKNWDTIKNALKAVWDWIRSTWNSLTDILTAPFRIAADAIRGAIDRVKQTVQGAWDFVSRTVRTIIDAVMDIPGRIASVGGRIADLIKRPINAIIRAWNGLQFELPSAEVFGHKIGGGTIGTPHVPELAKGGLVTGTGLAVVHRGEVFSGVQNQAGFGRTYNINIEVRPGTDPAQTGRAVVDLIRAYERANGQRVLAS